MCYDNISYTKQHFIYNIKKEWGDDNGSAVLLRRGPTEQKCIQLLQYFCLNIYQFKNIYQILFWNWMNNALYKYFLALKESLQASD